MATVYQTPGVYIEEKPAGSRPIQGVGTAVAAFLGFTEKRPQGNTGQPRFVASWTQYEREFGGFVEGFYMPYAIYGFFLNGGASCYVQSLATVPNGEQATQPIFASVALPTTGGAPRALELRSRPDTSAQSITVEVVDSVREGKGDDEFTLIARAPGQPDEIIPDLTMGRGRDKRAAVETINRESKLVQAIEFNPPGTLAERRPKNGTYSLTTVLVQPQTAALPSIEELTGDVTERTGLGAFEEIADVTMMVCPDLMTLYERGNKTEAERLTVIGFQKELLAHCTRMKDRFAILDAPSGLDIDAVRRYRLDEANFDEDSGKYGALYYPWIAIANPFYKNGQPDERRTILVPPSGHIAGIYARVDQDRGVHKAPANEAVRGALKLERVLIDSEQARLNPKGINCIRAFPGRGILVWGARTLAEESSEWRYINVRRLFNFVEESIFEGTQWVVFEPNDMDTWERVKRTITAFLTRVWRDGALFGATPEEAFYVKCDADLNTSAVRDAGMLIVEVGLAPVKPAEFVIFRFTQITDGGGGVSE